MKRRIKLVITDEYGRSEDSMRNASEMHALAARRLSYQLMCDKPVTDAQWAKIVAKAKKAQKTREKS